VSDVGVPLAEAIGELRSELQLAMDQGQDEELRFRLGDVELEFHVGVTKAAGVVGGVKFWLVSLEAKGSVDTVQTQTVKLTLKPETVDGHSVLIADEVTGPVK
jgi:hypothetical protein